MVSSSLLLFFSHVFTRNAATGLLRDSAEIAFYVSDAPLTCARAAEAIRAH